MQIYLVRHATPDWKAGGAYHTPPGPPLTDVGMEEAESAARLLEHKGIARVVSSPMQRCLMTAETLCGRLGLDLVVDPDIGEVQPGEAPVAIAMRMLRATLAQIDVPAVALVSHAGALERLMMALTHDLVTLPAPDKRGARVGCAQVWHVRRYDGRWHAGALPVGSEVGELR